MNYELKDTEHNGPIPAQRICWEDGSWWDVLVEIPYGVRSRIRAQASSLIKASGGSFEADKSDTRGMMQAIEDANMQRLVGCTVAWSWDMPVKRESIEAMSPRFVNDVLQVMRQLQDDDMLGSGTNATEKKTSPSQSSTISLSGVNGRVPETT